MRGCFTVLVVASGRSGRCAALAAEKETRGAEGRAVHIEQGLVVLEAGGVNAVDGHDAGWQAAMARIGPLLEAGTDVVATVDVAEIASLRDAATRILGRSSPSIAEDGFLHGADDVRFVDMDLSRVWEHREECPRCGLQSGSRRDARQVAALRSLALTWVAGVNRRGLSAPRSSEQRPVMVVPLSGGTTTAELLGRAMRLAARSGVRVLALHVAGGEHIDGDVRAEAVARVCRGFGIPLTVVDGPLVVRAIADFATEVQAERVLVGSSRRFGFLSGTTRSFKTTLARHDETLTVEVCHLVHPRPGSTGGPRWVRLLAWAAALVMPIGVGWLWAATPEFSWMIAPSLLYVSVIAVAAIGGVGPGLLGVVMTVLSLVMWPGPDPVLDFDVEHRVLLGVLGALAGLLLVAATRQWRSAAAADRSTLLR